MTSLTIKPPACVAIAGSGGKTTLLTYLARQAQSQGLRVLVSTTTHIQHPFPLKGEHTVLRSIQDGLAAKVSQILDQGQIVVLVAQLVTPQKWQGPSPELIGRLACHADLVLVEADGARGRAFKAPAAYEPVFPPACSHAIVVAGLDALGQPLTSQWAHRLEIIRSQTGLAPGASITVEAMAQVLTRPANYWDKLAQPASRIIYLAKYQGRETLARSLAQHIRAQDPTVLIRAGEITGSQHQVVAFA